MASVYDPARTQRFNAPTTVQPISRSAVSQPNSISASQARAARRRAARRDEQAVAAWLRELASRTR